MNIPDVPVFWTAATSIFSNRQTQSDLNTGGRQFFICSPACPSCIAEFSVLEMNPGPPEALCSQSILLRFLIWFLDRIRSSLGRYLFTFIADLPRSHLWTGYQPIISFPLQSSNFRNSIVSPLKSCENKSVLYTMTPQTLFVNIRLLRAVSLDNQNTNEWQSITTTLSE